jgi:hypothetical protein
MDKPSISYHALPDATPESELETLVACYSFLIECSENRKAAESHGVNGEEVVKTVSQMPSAG